MDIELVKALKTMNKNIENENSDNLEVEDVEALDENETDIDVIKEHAKKVNDRATAIADKNKQLFERTKKAEGFVKGTDGKWTKPQTAAAPKTEATVTTDTKEKLTQSDFFALVKADIHEDDIDDVVEYAALKKIPVADALRSSVVKTIIAEKIENRKVAEGTSTGSNNRSKARLSDSDLIANASNGKMPESDDDIKRLAEARWAAKLKGKK